MRQWKVCSGCWCGWRLYCGLYWVTSWPSSLPPQPPPAHLPLFGSLPSVIPLIPNPHQPSLEGPLMHEGTNWRVTSQKHKVGCLSTRQRSAATSCHVVICCVHTQKSMYCTIYCIFLWPEQERLQCWKSWHNFSSSKSLWSADWKQKTDSKAFKVQILIGGGDKRMLSSIWFAWLNFSFSCPQKLELHWNLLAKRKQIDAL